MQETDIATDPAAGDGCQAVDGAAATAHHYRMSEAAAQRRLQDFEADPQPTSLKREIALQRFLIEDAVNAGASGVANLMMATLSRMTKAEEQSLYKSGDLLAKDAVMAIADRISELTYEVFAHRFDGWEDAMEDLADGIATVIGGMKNELTAAG